MNAHDELMAAAAKLIEPFLGTRMRRLILTEMAEVWARRSQRARLYRQQQDRIDRLYRMNGKVTEGEIGLRDARKARLDGDREHLASLRRLLAAVRGQP